MTISVFLADDNLIVRMGVRALLDRESDLEVVGVAADYDELLAGAVAAAPGKGAGQRGQGGLPPPPIHMPAPFPSAAVCGEMTTTDRPTEERS